MPRRAELLAIAARLFAERGFKNTTVRDIAEEAGILSGSLYHHFASKEAMVDELLDTFQTELWEQYDAIDASDRTPREKLEAVVRVMGNLFRQGWVALSIASQHNAGQAVLGARACICAWKLG